MGLGVNDHYTLLYEVLYLSLMSKPLLMDRSLEREQAERREVQCSSPELSDLSVVERSGICHSIRRSFLGIR